MWFQGDSANRVNCGCDFVNKVKPGQTTAAEKGWLLFKNYDMKTAALAPTNERSKSVKLKRNSALKFNTLSRLLKILF